MLQKGTLKPKVTELEAAEAGFQPAHLTPESSATAPYCLLSDLWRKCL